MTNRIDQTTPNSQPIMRETQAQSQLLQMPLEIIRRIGKKLCPRQQADLSSTCYVSTGCVPNFEKTNMEMLRKEVRAIDQFLTETCTSEKAKAALQEGMPEIHALVEKMTLQNTKEIRGKIGVALYRILYNCSPEELTKIRSEPNLCFDGIKFSTFAAQVIPNNAMSIYAFKFLTICSEFVPKMEINDSLFESCRAYWFIDKMDFFLTVLDGLCKQSRFEEAEELTHYIQGMNEVSLRSLCVAIMAFLQPERRLFFVTHLRLDQDWTRFLPKVAAILNPHLVERWAKKMEDGDLAGAIQITERMMTKGPGQLLETIRWICKDIDQNTHLFPDNQQALEALCFYLLKKFSLDEIRDHFLGYGNNKLDTFHEGKVFALKLCEMLARDKKYKEAFEIADRDIGNMWITEQAFYIIIDQACKDPEITANGLIDALSSIRNTMFFFHSFRDYKKYDAFPGWVRYIQRKKGVQYVKSFMPAWPFSREKDRS